MLLDEWSRIVSAYRFDVAGQPVSAAIESWDQLDLAELLDHRIGVPAAEAKDIGRAVTASWEMHTRGRRAEADRSAVPRTSERSAYASLRSLDNAGVGRRFVAVLLDAVIVLFPTAIVIGLLSGGGYSDTGAGYANAGIRVEGNASWLLLALALGYYVVCEAMTGATLGKRMVGIRVVGEDGAHLTLVAAVVRNALRLVDGLFFYLVGAIFALASQRGQRLGDRAAHTVVVRR